jgi:uncharacterized repeat protein (TIGR02543 family)
MKRVKKVLTLLLVFVMGFVLSGCKKDPNPDPNKEQTEEKVEVTFETFGGTNIPKKEITKGEKINEPIEPEKENHLFDGWYLDSSFKTAAVFPLTISKDTTIYASFLDSKTIFLNARKRTVGVDVQGYEYDYTLHAQANLSNAGIPIAFNGNTNGNTKYSRTGSIKFYDEHINSGSLFYDGTIYKMLENNTLRTIRLNEDNIVTKVDLEQVDSSYDHDSSTFAKALFEYEANDILEMKKTETKGEFELKTKINKSSIISLVCNNLNSEKVKKVLGNLPETAADTKMFVEIKSGKITKYKFVFAVAVEIITFSITYELEFKNVGVSPSITPKLISGLALTDSEINSHLNTMRTIINNYQNQAKSSYDFELTTAIDYGLSKAEVNSKFKGSTMRKVDGNKTYFHNIIDITSNDYKKAELYKGKGLDDIKIHKSMLVNGEVWLIEKKALKDKTKEVTPYIANRSDEFYLLDLYNKANDINYIQTTVDSKTGETIHALGLTHQALVSMLTWLNDELNVDPFDYASVDVKIFGDFNSSTIKESEAELQVRVKDNKLTGIHASAEGLFNTKYSNSAQYTSYEEVEFDFEYNLTPTDKALKWEPYTRVKDAQ